MIIRQPFQQDFAVWRAMALDYDPDLVDVTEQAWGRFFGAAPYICMLAVEKNVPVGFIHYTFHDFCFSRGKNCYVSDLYVSPSHRRKGIARALLTSVLDTAKKMGWSRVYWVTEFDNPARGLYDSLGIAEFVRYHVDFKGKPEPDCINCGLPTDPSCYCERGRKANAQQRGEA
jgi:GNAT superfamily N-acetyltransferase